MVSVSYGFQFSIVETQQEGSVSILEILEFHYSSAPLAILEANNIAINIVTINLGMTTFMKKYYA